MDSTGNKTTAVLLATYNGAAYLEEFLHSLEAQSFQDFVIHVHDDGSTDESRFILERYASQNPGKLLFYKDAPQGLGARDSFFWLLQNVVSDTYFFADQDDVWLPEKMASLMGLMETASDVSVHPVAVFCDAKVVDEELRELQPSFLQQNGFKEEQLRLSGLLIDNVAPGCTMAINHTLRELMIRIPDTSGIEMHDGAAMALASAFGEVHYTREALVLYRQHGNNEMGASRDTVSRKLGQNAEGLAGKNFRESKRGFLSLKTALAKALLQVEESLQKDPVGDYAKSVAGDTMDFGKISPEVHRMLLDFSCILEVPPIKRIHILRKYHIRRLRFTLWFYVFVAIC